MLFLGLIYTPKELNFTKFSHTSPLNVPKTTIFTNYYNYFIVLFYI